MKRLINIFLSLSLVLIVFGACQKQDVNPGGTATEKLAGEWYVQQYGIDLTDYGYGYWRIGTFNTSSNVTDSIWVDDYDNLFPFRVKVPCNLTGETFGSPDVLVDVYNGASFIINSGKIISNGTHSPGGLQVDSIYFELTDMSDTSQYVLAGYRDTGWEDDLPSK